MLGPRGLAAVGVHQALGPGHPPWAPHRLSLEPGGCWWLVSAQTHARLSGIFRTCTLALSCECIQVVVTTHVSS